MHNFAFSSFAKCLVLKISIISSSVFPSSKYLRAILEGLIPTKIPQGYSSFVMSFNEENTSLLMSSLIFSNILVSL